MAKPKLLDLFVYVGNSGGTHGLYDVTAGTVYLHNGLPHCKIHGAMLKVSADGIWRCGDPVHHGAYFNNPKSSTMFRKPRRKRSDGHIINLTPVELETVHAADRKTRYQVWSQILVARNITVPETLKEINPQAVGGYVYAIDV